MLTSPTMPKKDSARYTALQNRDGWACCKARIKWVLAVTVTRGLQEGHDDGFG